MKVLVLNPTHELKEVHIIDENGKADSVNIMPRSRAELKVGCTVNPSWASQNPEVKVINPVQAGDNDSGDQE